jgi:dipeptidase E
MKLFLASVTIGPAHGGAFLSLTGKKRASDVTIAVIENAADVYAEENKAWVHQCRDAMAAHGFKLDLIDLKAYQQGSKDLQKRLTAADAIWLGGGNTYYLRWILKQTGADVMITGLVRNGTVYGGGSAGAIVAGPTLHHFEKADDPQAAPRVLTEGLGLIRTVIVPHWRSEKYGHIMEQANRALQSDGFETVTLTDDQVLVTDGRTIEVIP